MSGTNSKQGGGGNNTPTSSNSKSPLGQATPTPTENGGDDADLNQGDGIDTTTSSKGADVVIVTPSSSKPEVVVAEVKERTVKVRALDNHSCKIGKRPITLVKGRDSVLNQSEAVILQQSGKVIVIG